jgi:hypothetical protein
MAASKPGGPAVGAARADFVHAGCSPARPLSHQVRSVKRLPRNFDSVRAEVGRLRPGPEAAAAVVSLVRIGNTTQTASLNANRSRQGPSADGRRTLPLTDWTTEVTGTQTQTSVCDISGLRSWSGLGYEASSSTSHLAQPVASDGDALRDFTPATRDPIAQPRFWVYRNH